MVEIKTNLQSIKNDFLNAIIEILSNEFDDESPYISSHRSTMILLVTKKPTMLHHFHTLASSLCSSTFSYRRLHPNSQAHLIVMQCFGKLPSIHGLRNELTQIDFDAIDNQRV